MLCLPTLALFGAAIAMAPAKKYRPFAVSLTNKLTGNCTAHVEETPWIISNITLFNAQPGTDNAVSYFDFTFQDINKGLEEETYCQHNIILEGTDADASVADGQYHGCVGEDPDVIFKFDGRVLEIQRAYKDKCLGDPPYDGATAHGRLNVTLTKISTPESLPGVILPGVMYVQTEMNIPITELS